MIKMIVSILNNILLAWLPKPNTTLLFYLGLRLAINIGGVFLTNNSFQIKTITRNFRNLCSLFSNLNLIFVNFQLLLETLKKPNINNNNKVIEIKKKIIMKGQIKYIYISN